MQLYHPNGRHIIEFNEPEPQQASYRRRTIGFGVRETREETVESVLPADDRDDGSSDCDCNCHRETEEEETCWVEDFRPEEEEDESCGPEAE